MRVVPTPLPPLILAQTPPIHVPKKSQKSSHERYHSYYIKEFKIKDPAFTPVTTPIGITALSKTLPSQSIKRVMPTTFPPLALTLPSQASKLPSRICSRVHKIPRGTDSTQMNGNASWNLAWETTASLQNLSLAQASSSSLKSRCSRQQKSILRQVCLQHPPSQDGKPLCLHD